MLQLNVYSGKLLKPGFQSCMHSRIPPLTPTGKNSHFHTVIYNNNKKCPPQKESHIILLQHTEMCQSCCPDKPPVPYYSGNMLVHYKSWHCLVHFALGLCLNNAFVF